MPSLLKKVLKSILPITWLKKGFIISNKLKINTVDKILFPEFALDAKAFLIQRDVPVYDNLNIDEQNFSSEIKSRLNLWHHWTQDEYLFVFNQPCTIEPKYGWALSGGKLIYASLGFSRADYLPKPSFIRIHFIKNKRIHVPQIISLRDTGEENYFHFFNDVLAKLYFLEEHLVLEDVPILISKKLYEKTYFQYYLKHSAFLRERNWIIQQDEFITADRAIFCKPLTHTKKYLERIVSSLNLKYDHSPIAHKIFLYRSPKRLRYISNFQEVINLCKTFGFEIIDTDELSISEQITWFRNASHIIGVHGAGMVNMIYGQSTIKKIIEIFPPWDYVPFHYIMLAKIYGFEYDAVLGKKGKESLKGGFDIDITVLEAKLKNDATLV